ncbi:Uncharacterised protein [Leminorella grimontii]|nr:Uncharacterised protein [Leminorella grimontii]
MNISKAIFTPSKHNAVHESQTSFPTFAEMRGAVDAL